MTQSSTTQIHCYLDTFLITQLLPASCQIIVWLSSVIFYCYTQLIFVSGFARLLVSEEERGADPVADKTEEQDWCWPSAGHGAETQPYLLPRRLRGAQELLNIRRGPGGGPRSCQETDFAASWLEKEDQSVSSCPEEGELHQSHWNTELGAG